MTASRSSASRAIGASFRQTRARDLRFLNGLNPSQYVHTFHVGLSCLPPEMHEQSLRCGAGARRGDCSAISWWQLLSWSFFSSRPRVWTVTEQRWRRGRDLEGEAGLGNTCFQWKGKEQASPYTAINPQRVEKFRSHCYVE